MRCAFIRYFDVDEAAAEVLAELTTFESSLPAGAPTSPVLANLVLLDLDQQLIAALGETPYSRFLDDITISGGSEIARVIPELVGLIELTGFRVNESKTRVLGKNVRQSVTGVVVNESINAPKTLRRKIRQHLYYCRRWGLQEHAEHNGVGIFTMEAKIRGAIGFVEMIDWVQAAPLHRDFTSALNAAEETPEEALLDVIQRAVDNEAVLEFDYDVSRREVAPSEVFVANGNYPSMRGWQLSPHPGWRVYLLEEMTEVVVKPAPSSSME